MSTANLELARRGYEAILRGDLRAAGALLDEHVRWHWGDPEAEGACRNREQALAFLAGPERTGPGELVDMIDAGERVVVILRPPPIDGQPAPLRAQVTTFRDGRVVEMVGFSTVEDALASAGVEWHG